MRQIGFKLIVLFELNGRVVPHNSRFWANETPSGTGSHMKPPHGG